MTIGLAVPVLSNFRGFAELMASVDVPVRPFIIANWKNNVGVGPAWNIAIAEAMSTGTETLIVVNDDVIFRPGVMAAMVWWLDRGIDLVSPQNETGRCHPHGLNFWCFAIKPKEFVSKFGTFDENFAPAYYEDDDMARRMRLLGGSMKTLDHRIYHEVEATSTEATPRSVWDRNYAYYVAKWGGPPMNEKYSTPFNNPDLTPKDWNNGA